MVAYEYLEHQTVIGRQYVLLIAIDEYQYQLPLRYPVTDAREIRDILEQNYYIDEVIELYNQDATRVNIARTFISLQEKLDVHDSLFIYYAGHGEFDKNSNTGFWIPSDGGRDRIAQENWLSNSQIQGFISNFKSNHVFMIIDACFAGEMIMRSRSLPPEIDNAFYRRAYTLQSRYAITSGALEVVPDRSVFSEVLKITLRRNTSPVLDPLSIYTSIAPSIRGHLPLHGEIKNTIHQPGASYLFFRRPAAQSAVVARSDVVQQSALSIYSTVGNIIITSYIAGTVMIDGVDSGFKIKEGGNAIVPNVATGNTEVAIKTDDGTIIKALNMVMVRQGQDAAIEIFPVIQDAGAAKTIEDAQTLIARGTDYYNLGDFKNAIECFFEASDLFEKIMGKDHPDYAASLYNLGFLYDSIGDYVKAEIYYLEAASIREKILGKDHPSYAASLNNLGMLYYNMGDYVRAERYYLEAINIWEKVFGKEHPDYAASLNNLGILYYNMNDYIKAERYSLEAISILEKTLGKEYPGYARSLSNLGALYWSIADYAKAEYYHREALSIREKTLGKEHPDYAASLNNLGMLYESMGDYARAERYHREALSIREKILGKEHPDYAQSLNNLGALYRVMGDYARAETYCLESFYIRERILGVEHLDYADSLKNLGLLYFDMKDSARAEAFFLKSRSVYERVLGKDNHFNIPINDALNKIQFPINIQIIF